jgi:hypothetical protein
MNRKGFSGVPFLLCLLVGALVTPVAAQFDPVGELLFPTGVSGSFRCVAEKDGYVYATVGYGNFYVYDVRSLGINGPFSTFNAPISEQDLGNIRSMLRVGNTLYLALNASLEVMDITNPASPAAGTSVSGGSFRYMSQSGDYLLAAGSDYLGVYSITDPAHPTLVASTTLGGDSAYSVALSNQHIYVGVLRSGTFLLSVFSWPGGATITPVTEIPLPDVTYHLFVNGSYLAGTWGNEARLWSLADPAAPVQVNEQPAAGRAALLWGNKLVTNGRVHAWHGPLLELFTEFAPGGSQLQGSPYDAAGSAKFIFIAQDTRILILVAPPTLVFPQYVNGQVGGVPNRTRLLLRNTGAETASGTVHYRTSAGAPKPVPIGGVNQSAAPYSIPAGGTAQITTDGTGTLAVGPLELRSDTIGDTDIRGTEVFDLLGYSVSVQNAPLAKVHEAFVSRTGAENTGVAMYNPNLSVSCQAQALLFDKNGVQVAGPVTLTLQPRHQMAIFVNDPTLFQAYLATVAGGFEGVLRLTVTNGGPISVVSLLQKPNGALLAVPVESQTPAGP